MQLHCLVLGCLIGKTSYECGMSEHGEYREMCNNAIVMLSNFATRAPEQNLILARDGAEFTDVLARLDGDTQHDAMIAREVLGDGRIRAG